MEIKIGNCDIDIEDPKNAEEYARAIRSTVRSLFLISGIKRDDDQVTALSNNLHTFLIENKEFIIGIVNAGRIKS